MTQIITPLIAKQAIEYLAIFSNEPKDCPDFPFYECSRLVSFLTSELPKYKNKNRIESDDDLSSSSDGGVKKRKASHESGEVYYPNQKKSKSSK